MQWLVSESKRKFHLNIASYSSIFVNHSTNEQAMVGSIIQYFQPRSKVKDIVKVYDSKNNFEEISHHAYYAHMFSNDLLLQETQLGAKTVLKANIKKSLGSHIETDGYLMTINTLIEDLLEKPVEHLPVKLKRITIDSLIKLLYVELEEQMENTNYYLHQSNFLLKVLVDQLKKDHQKPIVLVFNFPESYLSPKEQLEMRKLLNELAENISVLVVTKSLIFIADDFAGMNYFLKGNQLFDESLLEELEWESPVDYDKIELRESLIQQFRRYANYLELSPTISNYRTAEINLFNSMDLYVLVFLLNKLDFDYFLDLEEEKVVKPVIEYVRSVYGEV